MSAFFQIRKKVHWSDTDAAGVVWFPNFLGWFEDAEEEHLRVDFGPDVTFLPDPDLPNGLFMAQSNIRSLLHFVHEADTAVVAESRRLWTETGENFAERLQAALEEV